MAAYHSKQKSGEKKTGFHAPFSLIVFSTHYYCVDARELKQPTFPANRYITHICYKTHTHIYTTQRNEIFKLANGNSSKMIYIYTIKRGRWKLQNWPSEYGSMEEISCPRTRSRKLNGCNTTKITSISGSRWLKHVSFCLQKISQEKILDKRCGRKHIY